MIKEFVSKHFIIKGFQKPKDGNIESGDDYLVIEESDYCLCVMVDGLGSGKGAKKAASAIVQAVNSHHEESLLEIMNRCNEAVRYQRGAVMSLFKYFYQTKKVEYSSVGNVRLVFIFPDGTLIRPIPVPGYLSGRIQTFKMQSFQLRSNVKFLFYSDGLQAPRLTKGIIERIKSSSIGMGDFLYPFVNENMHTRDDLTLLVGTFK